MTDVDTTGDSMVYLRGPVTSLNSALANLSYTPYSGYTGDDILTITAMDNDANHLGSRDPVQRTKEQRMILHVT